MWLPMKPHRFRLISCLALVDGLLFPSLSSPLSPRSLSPFFLSSTCLACLVLAQTCRQLHSLSLWCGPRLTDDDWLAFCSACSSPPPPLSAAAQAVYKSLTGFEATSSSSSSSSS